MRTVEARVFPRTISSADWGGRLTRAEVSLDAIEANARLLKRATGSARLLAVVKANGYGHGSVPVAAAALRGGAEWLGVYAPEEGLELRQAGITSPVLVFGPFSAAEAADLLQAELTPTVTTLEAAGWLEAVASKPFSVHIKVDTGLSRAGTAPEQVPALVERLASFAHLRVQGMYTHFAAADEPDPGPTLRQWEVFRGLLQKLEEQGRAVPIAHAANSAATLDFPASHRDMVRTGIALYGYYPSPSTRNRVPLRPALTLQSTVTRVHSVPAGTGVGYGHEFRCTRSSVIALVPIGYGDGLPRTLGHGRGRVILRGSSLPVVGRVSMDQITVDATDLPVVEVGDPVVVIGEQEGAVQTAEDLAMAAGTISYDILTGLLPRIPRLYTRGDRVVAVRSPTRGLVSALDPSAGP